MKRSLRVAFKARGSTLGQPLQGHAVCAGVKQKQLLWGIYFYFYFRVYVLGWDRNSHFRAVFFRVYCGGGAETAGCVLGCMCHGDMVCGLFRSEVD